MVQAYVVSGAVIVSDNGTIVRFHPKCDKCGYVETNFTSQIHCAHGTSSSGGCSCPRCGQYSPTVIGRG